MARTRNFEWTYLALPQLLIVGRHTLQLPLSKPKSSGEAYPIHRWNRAMDFIPFLVLRASRWCSILEMVSSFPSTNWTWMWALTPRMGILSFFHVWQADLRSRVARQGFSWQWSLRWSRLWKWDRRKLDLGSVLMSVVPNISVFSSPQIFSSLQESPSWKVTTLRST